MEDGDDGRQREEIANGDGDGGDLAVWVKIVLRLSAKQQQQRPGASLSKGNQLAHATAAEHKTTMEFWKKKEISGAD